MVAVGSEACASQAAVRVLAGAAGFSRPRWGRVSCHVRLPGCFQDSPVFPGHSVREPQFLLGCWLEAPSFLATWVHGSQVPHHSEQTKKVEETRRTQVSEKLALGGAPHHFGPASWWSRSPGPLPLSKRGPHLGRKAR